MTGTVRIGRIDESFHQVASAVVEEVLTRLGHTVQMREDAHPVMYPLLVSGELDLFADAWLPGGHAVYWEQVKDHVTELAPLYDNALFYWAVPGYVPQDEVGSLKDLARPQVVQRMTTLDVIGTKPSAGLSMRSEQLLIDYGLNTVGYRHVPGDIHAVIDNVNTRMAAGDWFATPLWQPMFLNEVHDLRPLADPLGVFPPPDRASLLATNQALAALPARTRAVLARIRFTVADVNAMDCRVALDSLDPNAAAAEWLDAHSDLVATWFD